jgi:hypothetical protein
MRYFIITPKRSKAWVNCIAKYNDNLTRGSWIQGTTIDPNTGKAITKKEVNNPIDHSLKKLKQNNSDCYFKEIGDENDLFALLL